jgi:predicted nucleic-acid-binding protein
MSPKNLIDSNVLLRYLTWDDPEKAERCKELFKRLEFGIETAILSEMTLAEVIWTLQKFFKLEKSSIRDILKPILNFKGLKVQNREIILKALDMYANHNVDFPDAYISELSKKLKAKVYSYDKDLSRLGAIRTEP